MFLRHSVYLSDNQLKKIHSAAKNKTPVTIRIDPRNRGNHYLYLTQTQVNSLKKGTPKDITISRSGLTKQGGFVFSIPAILAGIGAAASVAGGAANVARAINEKKHQKVMQKLAKGKGVYLPGKKNLEV